MYTKILNFVEKVQAMYIYHMKATLDFLYSIN